MNPVSSKKYWFLDFKQFVFYVTGRGLARSVHGGTAGAFNY